MTLIPHTETGILIFSKGETEVLKYEFFKVQHFVLELSISQSFSETISI